MLLSDLSQYVGDDLATSGTGDRATASGTLRGQQRVVRRLLTNPGDYLFHPEYGAGLPQYIGRTADVGKIKSLVLGQMLLEDAVARQPVPQVMVAHVSYADGGGFAVTVRYVDAATGQPVALTLPIGNTGTANA
jgi:hypothetical protein